MRSLFVKNHQGFSLLEIIIAIAIIAIFTVLPILAYTNYQKKSRDEKRKSDIARVSQALESYKAEKGVYPPDLNTLVNTGFLPELPQDPLQGQSVPWDLANTFGYSFSSPDGTNYTLSAVLEAGGASGGAGNGGVGAGTMSPGNISGTFTGTGDGSIDPTDVSVAGTVTNGTFTGTFTGNVTGAGISGSVNGSLTKSVTGNVRGNVVGTAHVNSGSVSGTSFTGSSDAITVNGTGSGSVYVASPSNPGGGVIPVSALTQAALSSPTPSRLITQYLSPTPIGAITNTPTVTPTPTATYTPSPTPTIPSTWIRYITAASSVNGGFATQNSDGSYTFAGSRYNYYDGTFIHNYPMIQKLNNDLSLNWSTTYTPNTCTNCLYSLSDFHKTTDGGYISLINGSLVAKYDSNGNQTWLKTTNGSYLMGVTQTTDGGYVAYGDSDALYSPGYVAKFDSLGTLTWTKNWSQYTVYNITGVSNMADGNFIVTGYIYNFNRTYAQKDTDSTIAKKETGQAKTSQVLGANTALLAQRATSTPVVTATPIPSNTPTPTPPELGWSNIIMKMNATDGTITATNTWMFKKQGLYEQSSASGPIRAIQLSDGSFLTAEQAYNYSTYKYYLALVSFSSSLSQKWEKIYPAVSTSNRIIPMKIMQASDGNIILVSAAAIDSSTYYTDIIVTKFSTAGVVLWSKRLVLGGDQYPWSVEETIDHSILVGSSDTSTTPNRGLMMKMNLTDGTISNCAQLVDFAFNAPTTSTRSFSWSSTPTAYGNSSSYSPLTPVSEGNVGGMCN